MYNTQKDSVPSYKEQCRLFGGTSNWTHMLNKGEREGEKKVKPSV